MVKQEKIFFIYPPSSSVNRQDDCEQPIINPVIMPRVIPFDMMSLSAIAKQRGYETKFKDYTLEKETVFDFVRDIRTYKPDFLVISTNFAALEKDLSILNEAAELLEETLVIIKGAVFNFDAYKIMQKYPKIDVVLKGDIEEAFDEIIQYKNLKDIKGIVYQVDNKIVSTQDRKIRQDLNYLPFLDRDLINNNIYIRPDTKRPITAIKVSKGCPNDCFFCPASNLNGTKVRHKSPELVVEEVNECVEKYNIRDFIFLSDLFTADNDWVETLCELLLIRKLNIKFFANTRIDTINSETLNLMKAAGCDLLSVGVESGSQELLDKMGKNITIEKIKEGIENINRAKIPICAYYILGLPWETDETIKKTYQFAKELNTQYAVFLSAAAFIGTRFFEYVNKNRLGDINYQNPYIYPTVKGYELSSQEVFEYNKKFNTGYYKRPSYVFKMIKEINSINKFKTFYETFMKLIKN